MPLNVLFWVIFIIAVLVGYWTSYEPNQPWLRRSGVYTVLWVLIAILGYRVFGPAVR